MSASATAAASRIEALDGLRGLAALIVLFRHVFNSIEMSIEQQVALLQGPLSLFLNAQGGVQLFFVLSGFVLSGSLARSRSPRDYLEFYVRRVLRIHPPYVFALLFAWSMSFFYAPEVGAERGLSGWLQGLLAVHIPIDQLLASLRFPGQAYGQLQVGWTLAIELVFSFGMPVLFLAARRIHWGVLGLLAVPLLLGEDWYFWWYGWDFALGIALHANRDWLVSRWRSLGTPRGVGLLLVAGWLFQVSMWIGAPDVRGGRVASGFDAWEIFVMGFGAAGLIIGTLATPALGRFLSSPPMAFLGRISFSLYLLHTTILFSIAPWFPLTDGWGALALCVVLVGLSCAAASVGYYAVERPAIRLGSRVCKLVPRRDQSTRS